MGIVRWGSAEIIRLGLREEDLQNSKMVQDLGVKSKTELAVSIGEDPQHSAKEARLKVGYLGVRKRAKEARLPQRLV